MLTFMQTERLLLRQFTPDDAELLVEPDSDPRVMRYITGGIPTSRGEIEGDFLPAFLDYYQRFPDYGFWAANEKSTGEFLGWFHFRPGPEDPQDQPELGYRLRHAAWGKGHATEGSRALIAEGFTEFGVQRVVASTVAVNMASRKVMEKSGMRLVRAFVPTGRYPFRAKSAVTSGTRSPEMNGRLTILAFVPSDPPVSDGRM